jgi:hypothetical protein
MPQGYLVGLPQRLFDADNLPADGWLVGTFVADGTFTTELITYIDAALTSLNTNPIVCDASGYFRAFVAAGTNLDIEVRNASGVLQFTLLSQEPMASATSDSGAVLAYTVTFSETATGVSHVASIAIPAGATLLDAQTCGGVLWGGGAVVYKLGDTADDDGYFIGVNLKATDLLPGEVLSIAGGTSNWGGKNGAYLNATTGQRGPAASNFGTYYAAGSNIVATITVTTPAVTTGRTYLTVFYATGIVTAPVVT